MRVMLDAIGLIVGDSMRINASNNGIDSSQRIDIGSLNIHTNQLNENQDFRTAGTVLAEEFAKAIRQRGINVNVNK